MKIKEENSISVAMATYNGEKYLRQQLDSIFSQTMLPLEVVISDDGSTDNTLFILAEYQQKYNFIKLIKNPNPGINNNFIYAAQHCIGSWIAFCDQDDVWQPNKLECLFASSENKELVYSRSQLIDSEGNSLAISAEKYLGFGQYQSGYICPLYFFYSNCISGHSIIIQRDIIDIALPVPEGMIYDQWFSLIAACKGEIGFTDKALTSHRIHASNSNNNQDNRIQKKSEQNSPSKIKKFLQRRTNTLNLLKRIDKFSDNLRDGDRYIINKYSNYVRLSKHSFINIYFLFFMMRFRNEFFSKKAFKKALKEPLGGDYFKLIDFVLNRK